MQATKKSLSSVVLTIIFVLFTYTQAPAACTPTQQQNGECAQLGPSFTLEIVRSATGQFPFPATCNGQACSVFPYFLNQSSSNNQLNILVPAGSIPAAISGVSGCSQVLTGGGGDPTTGFGKGIVTFDVCRLAPTANATNLFGTPLSGTANLFVATLPALAGREAVQLKTGKDVFFDDILGSGGEIPPIATTQETITTGEGKTLTVTTDQQGNLLNATSPGGVTVFALADISVCFSGTNCQQVTHITDRCDIKFAGEDPCKTVRGSFVCY